MSPVWVKIGDFGVSKRILADGSTTLHTPVSSQAYSAPEVLGLDSNSETSDYTNSVDIWSLGCVIYELLVGTKLFALEGQVSRYYFGKWPFPEDKLKGISPPTDDIGISLLKSMLVIQPEDRPTAARALSHSWLAGIHSDNEDSSEDQDEVTQGRDESTRSAKRKNSLATHNRPKKRRSQRNQTKPANRRCIPGSMAFGAGAESQSSGSLSTRKTVIDTSVITQSPADAAPAKSLGVETRAQKSELMPHNFQATNSKGPNALRKAKICYIPQTCSQSSTPDAELNLLIIVLLMRIRCRILDLLQAAPQRSTPTVEIVFDPPGRQMGQRNIPERKRTKPSPSPQAPPPTELHHGFPHTEPILPGRAGSGDRVQRIPRTKPNTAGRGDDRNPNGTIINPMRNLNTRRSINRVQERNTKQTPNAGSNSNTGGSRNL